MHEIEIIDPFNEIDRPEADAVEQDIKATLHAIGEGERGLARGYAHLGGLLVQVKSNHYWRAWGFESWGSYIDYIRAQIGRQRAQIYNIVGVAESLLPAMSESTLESIGISKAQELKRFVKQSGRSVPDTLLELALDPKVGITELHAAVLEELHEKGEVKGNWHDFGGFYATAEEWAEITQAIEVATRVDPPIAQDTPDHARRKEVMLRFAREFYSSNIAEASGVESEIFD